MIFIVDDDQSIRTSLTRLFRSADYEVQAFANAEEYLYFNAGHGGAECVILDLLGPAMSGLDLQAVINRREPPVPVIILTGCEDGELLLKALSAGAVKVLRKPCDPDVLLRAVAVAVAPTSAAAAHAGSGAVDFVGRKAGLDHPDHFVLEEGRGRYRPQGTVSFDKAVALVRGAIAAALRNQVRSFLVDTTALDGFASPDTFQRFLAVVEWADEARGGLRLAMVARAEMIHPQKFGVLVAANRVLVSNIFTTEAEARAWLAARNGH